MPRGGRRPGAGAKRGPKRPQKSAAEIADRRRLVRQLHYMRRKPAEIVATIQREAPSLLSDLRRPYEAIIQDIAAIREEDAEAFQNESGLLAVTAYSERQTYLMTAVISASESLQGSDKVRAMKLAGEFSRDVARAQGVPTDEPAFHLDLSQLSPSQEGQDKLQELSRGTVAPIVFATDLYYCGLSLGKFPLQRQVLDEFFSPQNDYNELICVCGMRSGKGVLASIISWYQAYLLLQLDDPQAHFGLAPGQGIRIINVATSEDQARRNVFQHIVDRYETGGPWFRQPGIVLGEPRALEIRLAKHITIVCGHSHATSKLGGTYVLAVLDELARMKDTGGKDNAHEVYTKMRAATRTFGPLGRVVVISSPEWEGDEAMQLLELAGEVDEEGRRLYPRTLPIHLPTWEANLSISREMLADDERKNPTAFWRDFGADPPTALEAYYPDPERWVRQANPERRHPCDDQGRLVDSFSPCCAGRRFVHVNLALNRDACGFAMAHKPVPGCPYYETRDGAPNPRAKKVVLDLCGRFLPSPSREIDFESIRQVIRDLQDRGFNIKAGKVTLDGWQSVDFQQTLRKEGFRCQTLSVDRDLAPHDTLQELINTDQLSFYEHPVLFREARQLQLRKGTKVDHPPNGSKDMIDAVAGAVFQACKKGGHTGFVG